MAILNPKPKKEWEREGGKGRKKETHEGDVAISPGGEIWQAHTASAKEVPRQRGCADSSIEPNWHQHSP
jgi:hypothetical protein